MEEPSRTTHAHHGAVAQTDVGGWDARAARPRYSGSGTLHHQPRRPGTVPPEVKGMGERATPDPPYITKGHSNNPPGHGLPPEASSTPPAPKVR